MKLQACLASAAIGLALLAGCGNDTGSTNPVASAVGQMAKASLAKGKGDKAATSAATAPTSRQDLAAFGKPILRVRSERLGQDGFLTIADAKANVVTWTAQGQATFSLRDGILIQTRGLAADLMSAEAPSLEQLKSGASYPRVYFFLGQDDRGTRRTYACVASVVGREKITVLDRTHTVTHVSERCSRPNSQVTNDFWIEGKTIRKSRQWASSRISYVEFEQVID
ncbi:MAG: hypothetical protein FD150_310 [Rhodobacteraceae bacterium]|nr:MAG: hypothetical protein FD150_310 [Paracoccaceae bacterium]